MYLHTNFLFYLSYIALLSKGDHNKYKVWCLAEIGLQNKQNIAESKDETRQVKNHEVVQGIGRHFEPQTGLCRPSTDLPLAYKLTYISFLHKHE